MKAGDVENMPESKKGDKTGRRMRGEAQDRIEDELFWVWVTGRVAGLVREP